MDLLIERDLNKYAILRGTKPKDEIFEILNKLNAFCDTRMVVGTKNSAFWYKMPCNPLLVSRHFVGTCRLHLQGRQIGQAKDRQEAVAIACSACYLLHTAFLIFLFFDPEVGGMFLRNVG
jgi:hypothetical protein